MWSVPNSQRATAVLKASLYILMSKNPQEINKCTVLYKLDLSVVHLS